MLTVVAFFAILFTGRYPRGIFEFNVGVLRWTWRVAFYSYGALGSDRYPPFTLDEAPEYPATLELAYPERLSRGLVLVKWWLLAIPHYVVVGVFLGGGYAVAEATDWVWAVGLEAGLIGTLVLFAAVALLFTTRYPPGIFDFVLGLDRWVARVAVYVGLMTDSYPPFRLDQGGEDAAAVPTEPPPAPADAAAVAPAPLEPAREGGGAGRVVLIVVGCIAAVLAFGLLAGGCALVAVDQIQRDDDGFLMSPSEDFRTPTYAIVSESADIDTDGAEWALDAFLGTVRIRSESDRAVFVGIGPETEVNALPRRRRARRRDGLRGRAAILADAGRRAREPAGRPGVLGRNVVRVGGADARVGSRGRQLAGGGDERGRKSGSLVRDEHRSRARFRDLDRRRAPCCRRTPRRRCRARNHSRRAPRTPLRRRSRYPHVAIGIRSAF